jgi:hypothetical protein
MKNQSIVLTVPSGLPDRIRIGTDQPVRTFFLFSVLYFSLALAVASLLLPQKLAGLIAITGTALALWSLGKYFMVGIAGGVILLVFLVGARALINRLPVVVTALLGALFLQSGFTMFKNALPFMSSYFADPFLARLDKALHFGVDPWVLAHRIGAYLPIDLLIKSYTTIWSFPALALPVIIAATDTDRARIGRTLVLFVASWVFLGNVLALAGLSVGPVFYDRLLGEARFGELANALQTGGISQSRIGQTQQSLWEIYATGSAKLGAGISAFPSVHVGTATVAAIYMVERSRWLAPLAAAFLLFILFFSVYSGYHYAIDGYASIAVILALWWFLKKRGARSGASGG